MILQSNDPRAIDLRSVHRLHGQNSHQRSPIKEKTNRSIVVLGIDLHNHRWLSWILVHSACPVVHEITSQKMVTNVLLTMCQDYRSYRQKWSQFCCFLLKKPIFLKGHTCHMKAVSASQWCSKFGVVLAQNTKESDVIMATKRHLPPNVSPCWKNKMATVTR